MTTKYRVIWSYKTKFHTAIIEAKTPSEAITKCPFFGRKGAVIYAAQMLVGYYKEKKGA